MRLLDVFYRQNSENPHELDVLLKTNVGMWAYRNGTLVRDESYSLSSFELLPSIARLRREHGALALSDMRTSQENDLYILLSESAILAIENIPTPEGYIRELRVIESLDDENKADMDAFRTLHPVSWFAAKQRIPYVKISGSSRFDGQERMVFILTIISSLTGLIPILFACIFILPFYVFNYYVPSFVTGSFLLVVLFILIFLSIRYYIAKKPMADMLFPFVFIVVNIFTIILCSPIIFLVALAKISPNILFLGPAVVALISGYLTLKIKYAKEKRVLDGSVAYYVVNKFNK